MPDRQGTLGSRYGAHFLETFGDSIQIPFLTLSLYSLFFVYRLIPPSEKALTEKALTEKPLTEKALTEKALSQ